MRTYRSKAFLVLMAFIIMVTLMSAGDGSPGALVNQSYIVQGRNSTEVARLVEQVGGKVTSQLEIINSVGAELSPAMLKALKSDARIQQISPNATASSSDQILQDKKAGVPSTDYPDVTGADQVWKEDATGEGIGVAILDTGIDKHPSLLSDRKGKKRGIVAWVDFIDKKSNQPIDPNGHGTHIAGVIANAQKGADGEYNGMAPDVSLIGVRVLDKTGQGTYEGIIQGLQWVLTNKDKYHIRVVNLSLQTNVQSPYWADPLNQAVTRAWAEGLVVVTVAGNSGPNPMTITAPGNNPYAITVGAFTDNFTPSNWSDDYITPFSGAGPTLDGFVKPDLIAPGAHMVSTMSPNSYIATNHEANWISGNYFSMAGTSQAAAVVSGTVALMLSHNEDLTPNQVKYRLMVTAMPWVKADNSDTLYSMWQQGAGRLNAYDAVLSTSPEATGSANNGMDIQADLRGDQHYEGYSYYDETTGMFRLRGTEDWTSGFGAWSGGFGAWSGGFGAWSGGFGAWSGGFGAWSGGFGAWSGGFGAWSGGFGAWSGSVPWAATAIADPAFVKNFMEGNAPKTIQKTASIPWAEEPVR